MPMMMRHERRRRRDPELLVAAMISFLSAGRELTMNENWTLIDMEMQLRMMHL